MTVAERNLSSAELSALRAVTPTIEKVVAINNYLRSGSALLQSLFDWHPNTIATPAMYISRFYPFFELNSALPTAKLIDQFINDFSIIFDGFGTCTSDPNFQIHPETGALLGLRTLGGNRDQCLKVNQEQFRTCINAILAEYEENVPRKLFFQAVHVAYRHALNQPGNIDSNTRIIYPIHTPIPSKYTAQFAEDFPDAQYIVTVRKPIDSIAAMVKYLTRVGKIFENYLVAVFMPMLFAGVPTTNGVYHTSRALRLEDLHRAPREMMQEVCRWLDLPWDETLMKSTVSGLEWWGDSGSLQVQGFSEKVVARRHDGQLSPLDVLRLKVLLAPKNSVWGYACADADRSLVRKLMILPLLVVPFIEEIKFLQLERKTKLRFAQRNTLVERLPKPIVLFLWFFGIGSIYSYLNMRRYLFLAWIRTFAKTGPEVALLDLPRHLKETLDYKASVPNR
jgi:hypothetical protein